MQAKIGILSGSGIAAFAGVAILSRRYEPGDGKAVSTDEMATV